MTDKRNWKRTLAESALPWVIWVCFFDKFHKLSSNEATHSEIVASLRSIKADINEIQGLSETERIGQLFTKAESIILTKEYASKENETSQPEESYENDDEASDDETCEDEAIEPEPERFADDLAAICKLKKLKLGVNANKRVADQLNRMLAAALVKLEKDLALLDEMEEHIEQDRKFLWTNRRMVSFTFSYN